MSDYLKQLFQQPEYLHVLLNPFPIYGLAVGLIGLVMALLLRSRPAQVVALALILLSAAISWPVFELGEKAYDNVLTLADADGRAWLEAHEHLADQFIFAFYALAGLCLVAIFAPLKWPKSALWLAVAVLLLGGVVLGMGGLIAQAGGRIRHREFRREPPPEKVSQDAPGFGQSFVACAW